MTISVVIPTYNRASTVGAAIASALEGGEDVEVIVVDDGSTDDTDRALAGFGAAITVLRQANGGVSRARNAGLRAASGAFVKFVDSDDIVPAGALRRMRLAAEQAGPREIVLGDAECVHDDGRSAPGSQHGYGYGALCRTGPLSLTDLLTGGMQIELPLFPRAALLAVGGFDEQLYLGEDKEIALRLCHGGWRFSRVPLVTARIRIHGAARLSGSKGHEELGNLILYFERMRALIDAMPEAPRTARVALARHMWSEARDAARAGHRDRAASLFSAARSLGGMEAAAGGRSMRMLYRVMTPLQAERLSSWAKRIAGG